ncbi:YdcF family protein [Zobellia alginiliquefaciens]|uniref:YdcF family protein n=1 Tax=Zobellia alginiliquefaciens TaxID=3032586 RepID=UPI0023E476D2|nr:YdcF family protein [Zobellia alginiliquefaciens]
MKKLFFLTVFLILTGVTAQEKEFDQAHQNKTFEKLQNKNFYLFTAINNNQEVSEVLQKDKTLNSYLNPYYPKQNSLEMPKSGQEIINLFMWNDEAIEVVGKRLVKLSKKNKALADLIIDLRQSGNYANFKDKSDDDFLYKSWELCAKGMDTILEVYGLGKKPLYEKIDSVSYNVHSQRYTYGLNVLKNLVLVRPKEKNLFFQPSLDLSLWLLYANHRDEAVRYEPLQEKENAKAVETVKSTDFDNYDYGCLVVLGSGPETTRDRLSGMAKMRLQMAVNAYSRYKVPFIIVSGGHTHPFMTPYNEGVEMKRELIKIYGIPEERILIEPYARHTTTNMRNATRLMMSYGIPLEKKSLVITGPMHSSYLQSDNFSERCSEELGYQPIKLFERLSPLTIEFKGLPVSLHQNPYQPLDP